jgi:hypothetical protein
MGRPFGHWMKYFAGADAGAGDSCALPLLAGDFGAAAVVFKTTRRFPEAGVSSDRVVVVSPGRAHPRRSVPVRTRMEAQANPDDRLRGGASDSSPR